MIIYKTTNLITNNIYIGKYCGSRRNYLGSGIHLKAAINKYGKENFIRETIDSSDSKKDLNNKEVFWIAFYREKEGYTYNISDGGDGVSSGRNHHRYWLNKKQSKESNKKRSLSMIGKLAGKNNGMYGKDPWNKGKKIGHQSIETIQKTNVKNHG